MTQGHGLSTALSMKELADLLSESIHQQCNTMPELLIWELRDIFENLLSFLREKLNERRLFLNLPSEVILGILERIPGRPVILTRPFDPVWHSGIVETRKLLPISQTCRHLRRITFSLPVLWRCINTRDRSLIPTFVSRSKDVPLSVVINSQPNGAISTSLDTFYSAQSSRIRELHFFDILPYREYLPSSVLDSLLNTPCPILEAFSFSSPKGDQYRYPNETLPLRSDMFPNLRYLFLKEVQMLPAHALPQLTHLALVAISVREPHIMIAGVLSRCPCVESLVLDSLDPEQNVPMVQRRPHLPYLHRVVLRCLENASMEFYLALLPAPGPNHPQLALQVHCIPDDFRRIQPSPESLPLNSWMGSTAASLSIEALPKGHSIMLVGPDRALKVCICPRFPTDSRWESDRSVPLIQRLSASSSALTDMREAWVVNVATTDERSHDAVQKEVRDALGQLTAMESLVIVKESSRHDFEHPAATLAVLPTVAGCTAQFKMWNLRTLRLIHGYDLPKGEVHLMAERLGVQLPIKLDLSQVCKKAALGGLGSVEMLIVQTPVEMRVTEEDLEELRRYIRTVRHELVDEVPRMSVSAYCVESAIHPNGPWKELLW